MPRAGRLVQKELAVAGRRFRILVDGDDDRLDVLIAPAFLRGEAARLLKSFEKGRRFFLVVEPSHSTKSKPIPGPHQVYGFLTTSPNAVVAPIHPKAMPV